MCKILTTDIFMLSWNPKGGLAAIGRGAKFLRDNKVWISQSYFNMLPCMV